MNHDDFLVRRNHLRASRPELIDLSELNLYRSLAPHFGPIEPSTHAEAPWRCHVAERYLEVLDLPAQLKSRAQVSHGVRRSLRALFGLLARRDAVVGVPGDVYPVYLQLAAEAGVTVSAYQARLGLPDLAGLDAVLVCDPLKPWGGQLSAAEGARLTSWVQADASRLVIIDSAYATPPNPVALQLMHAQLAVLLVSLSKGWLVPDHAGLCLVPEAWQRATREAFSQLPKDEVKVRVGYAALTTHVARPRAVAEVLKSRAARLDEFAAARPALRAERCIGYFAVSACSFDDLLAQGVLGVPASVFGGPESLTVLSSLERANMGA